MCVQAAVVLQAGFWSDRCLLAAAKTAPDEVRLLAALQLPALDEDEGGSDGEVTALGFRGLKKRSICAPAARTGRGAQGGHTTDPPRRRDTCSCPCQIKKYRQKSLCFRLGYPTAVRS